MLFLMRYSTLQLFWETSTVHLSKCIVQNPGFFRLYLSVSLLSRRILSLLRIKGRPNLPEHPPKLCPQPHRYPHHQLPDHKCNHKDIPTFAFSLLLSYKKVMIIIPTPIQYSK